MLSGAAQRRCPPQGFQSPSAVVVGGVPASSARMFSPPMKPYRMILGPTPVVSTSSTVPLDNLRASWSSHVVLSTRTCASTGAAHRNRRRNAKQKRIRGSSARLKSGPTPFLSSAATEQRRARPQSGPRLDIAKNDGFAERCHRISGGDELVGKIPGVCRIEYALHYGRPLQLLRRIELVAPRHAARVVMREPLFVLLDGADDVTFHDLHVVDVVQKPDARRVDRLYDFHPERRVV